jgi:hypothetical protein
MQKISALSFVFAFSFSVAHAQSPKPTEITVQTMASGGSYYDVARGSKLNKYGAERISPTGYGFQLGIVSDQTGNLFLRHLSMKKQDDRSPLEKQTTINYQSAPMTFAKAAKAPITYFVNGQVLYYSQIDHHLYAVSEVLGQPAGATVATGNNKWTVISPNAGAKYDAVYQRGDFDFNAEVLATAAPIGFMKSKTTVIHPTQVKTAMFGGALKLKAVIKYKNRYYFKIEILQDYFQGYQKKAISASNRVGHYELGYLFNKKLAANLFASNSELVLVNTERHAIDVFNSFGLGVKYNISK